MSSTIIHKSLVSAALFAAAVCVPSMANAADLLIDPPVVEAPEVITQQAGGWYLRGDITYDMHQMDNPMYSVPGGTEVGFTSADLEDSFDLGLGIGYQINENFRVDLTGEYVFSADFKGSTLGYCGGLPPLVGGLPNPLGPNCISEDTSSYSAFKLLANAYVDLGNFNGFTPYVGAGIGGAYVSWDSLSNTATCIAGNATCAIPPATNSHGGTDSWRFAYALHAGFSYDIAHNTKLDLGYSYSHIAGGDMFKWLDNSGTQGYDKGIDSHVFRAGIRYQIW
ncbi:MAG: outer membrane protein [Rhizobiaceae bacterium]